MPDKVGYTAQASITRPDDTDAYGTADVIGAATDASSAVEFAQIGPAGRDILIVSTELMIEAASVIASETSYSLYLYSITPPSEIADNAASDLPAGDRAYFLGSLALGTVVDIGSSLYVAVNGINKQVKLSGTSLFGYLVTDAGHTPTAERVYNITLHTQAL